MSTLKNNWTIHKFGGSSLANAQCFQAVKATLSGKNEIVVVSAIKGVTTLLQQLIDSAKAQQDTTQALKHLRQIHTDLMAELLSEAQCTALVNMFKHDWDNIKSILQAVNLVQNYSNAAYELILSFGEQWSAQILNSFLSTNHKTAYCDASKILFVKASGARVDIDWQRSQAALEDFIKNNPCQQLVVTGFIASTLDGQRTILGRNGSDFSAAIFSKLVQAQALTIWTDVDGVFSADPRKVRSAFVIDRLSYEEAFELAYFGATVIHPRAIAPAMTQGISIYIKNTFKPEAPGTCICAQPQASKHLIKGLTSIDDIALINVEGASMIGIPGIAARLFDVLQQAKISVILISQASSEHSICLAIAEEQANKATAILNEYFQFEISRNQIKPIQVTQDCVILSIVGDSMVGTPGILGKLCYNLALASINIRAIAQGSSERNISVVIQRDDTGKALRSIHAGFYLSKKTISIGLIGPGLVGSALLQQIYGNLKQLSKTHDIDLCVRGIMTSKKMLLSHEPIDLNDWPQHLAQSPLAADVDHFANHILSDDMPHAVIIDCTANQAIADQYLNFINKGLHVITPNKRANSGDLNYYKKLKQTALQKDRCYFYETTVCAGLPVIKTLQDLIQTGDEIISIEGIVSGTLSYIFSEFSRGEKFSTIIAQAKELGYTEPDPRDDLSGMDVARKVVCLARELDLETTLDDVQVDNLVPNDLQSCTIKEFVTKLPQYDDQIAKQLRDLGGQHPQLAYVGSIKKDGSIKVGIQSYPEDHPFAQLGGTDNMLIFRSHRYNEQALIIRGPGAGAAVTAAGVFADLLRLCTNISLEGANI
ncbi:MAG: bifunctional aspartate kinase/homoserine dehydrogenase I [Gammaproteobacteria bacterium]